LRPSLFFLTTPAPTDTHTLSLHDALPILHGRWACVGAGLGTRGGQEETCTRGVSHHVDLERAAFLLVSIDGSRSAHRRYARDRRSEEHTSELQSRENLVCRLLLEKKKKKI